ncbi:MAG: DUF3494 domain-containing protein [Spirochaetes bacterium]|nr:DUF3494 domain-containing protein [Spirochaetota bacterium]
MRALSKYHMWFMTLLLVFSVTGCDLIDKNYHKSNNRKWWPLLLLKGGAVSLQPVYIGTSGDLTTAAGYSILAKTSIPVIPDPVFSLLVIGNVGLTPETNCATVLDSWTLTGLIGDPYFDSVHVPTPFHVYCAGNTGGTTAADLAQAEIVMDDAYDDAAARPHSIPDADYLDIGNPTAGILTNYNLRAGVYEWGTDLYIPTNLILTGSATDVWIFKVAGDFFIKGGRFVVLQGGALPENIFWQVAGNVVIGGNAQFKGIILSAGYIEMWNGATIDGRVLSQTYVDLDMATVIQP